MFLNRLNQEEKIVFLTLAHHIARIDGDFSENEQSVIATYCLEMQIEDIKYDASSFNLYTILEKIKNNETQKIILLEIIALVYADGLHIEEEKLLNIIMDTFEINPILFTVFVEWSKSILAISNQGQALIKL